MILFIDEHRRVFGGEPICRLLPIAPSTCDENVAQHLDVHRLFFDECNQRNPPLLSGGQ